MGLETGTYINSLVSTNPATGDKRHEGDNHLRLIKACILATWPNLAGPCNAVHGDFNLLTGLAAAGVKPMPGKGGTTRIPFYNAAADIPAGFTLYSAADDHAFLVDSVAGGTNTGTDDPTTHTPAGTNVAEGAHTHPYSGTTGDEGARVTAVDGTGVENVTNDNHTHAYSGTTGAGSDHTHVFTGTAYNPKQAHFCLATLNA